jgi:hypothetical protein
VSRSGLGSVSKVRVRVRSGLGSVSKVRVRVRSGLGSGQGQCSLLGSVLESAVVGLSLYRGGANILRVNNVHRFIVELVSDLSG